MGLKASLMSDKHYCTIGKDHDETISSLAPTAPGYAKAFRKLRKLTVISSLNPLSRDYFRSTAQIKAEKLRHLRSGYTWIIHPMSIFNFYRIRTLIVLWLITFFENPFIIAFGTGTLENTPRSVWRFLTHILDVLLGIDILINFCMGYQTANSREIELSPAMIARKYIKTYFFFDLMGTIPFGEIISTYGTTLSDETWMYISLLRTCRFVRLKTLLHYIETVTEEMNFNNSFISFICHLFSTILYVHWLACAVYLVPYLEYCRTKKFPETSWAAQAHIEPDNYKVSLLERYLHSLLTAACHFYGAGVGMYPTLYPPEQILLSIVLTLGTFYFTYVTALLIEVFSTVNLPESKYEELLHQLKEYMRSKNLPLYLRKRLLTYYENKFQKYFFKEQEILDSLSEHLRYEVFLHTCRRLISKVNLFQGLSKDVVGAVLAFMTPEVYLVNDVVARYGTPCENVWFISYGTIALYNDSGKEVLHLEDGQYFGAETGILNDNSQDLYAFNAVATETSELFRISKKDLLRIAAKHAEFRRRINQYSRKYSAMIQELVDSEFTSEDDRKNILQQLRQGKILETPKERQ